MSIRKTLFVLILFLPVLAGPKTVDRARRAAKAGDFRQADELFTRARGADERLDPADWLQWADVLALLGKPRSMVDALCNSTKGSPAMVPAAVDRARRSLADLDSDSVPLLARQFSECLRREGAGEPVMVLGRLIGFARALGQSDLEIGLMADLAGYQPDAGSYLAEAAGRFYVQGAYRQSVNAALKGLSLAKGDEAGRLAAMVSQSYLALGRQDSALYWIDRYGSTSGALAHQAAVLNQKAGRLERAAAIIKTMPAGLGRDTLEIRQELFALQPKKARRRAAEMTCRPPVPYCLRQAALWRARTALYDDDPQTFLALADSAGIDPSSPEAAEFLEYRWLLEQVASDPAARTDAGGFLLSLYTGRYDLADSLLRTNRYGQEARQHLELRRAHAAADEEDWDGVRSRLEPLDSIAAPPRALYLCGLARVHQGDSPGAQRLFEQLLLRYPRDLFSGRARLMLSRLEGSKP